MEKQNIVLTFFACNKDECLLDIALEACERLRLKYQDTKNIYIAIYNDGNNPLAREHSADFFETVNWNRGTHLDSYATILGQLEKYQELGERFSADWVVKIDSDTIVENLDWIPTGETDGMAGSIFFEHIQHICGSLYSIRPEAAKTALSNATGKFAERIKRGGCWEDLVIDVLVNVDWNVCRYFNPKGEAGRDSSVQWWKEKKLPMSDFLGSQSVTFKRRGYTDEIVGEALAGMREFWETLKEKDAEEAQAQAEKDAKENAQCLTESQA